MREMLEQHYYQIICGAGRSKTVYFQTVVTRFNYQPEFWGKMCLQATDRHADSCQLSCLKAWLLWVTTQWVCLCEKGKSKEETAVLGQRHYLKLEKFTLYSFNFLPRQCCVCAQISVRLRSNLWVCGYLCVCYMHSAGCKTSSLTEKRSIGETHSDRTGVPDTTQQRKTIWEDFLSQALYFPSRA